MQQLLITSLASLGLAGCVAVHAELPEEVLGSIHMAGNYHDKCVHGGQPYSEGAILCVQGQQLRCHDEEWLRKGDCQNVGAR